MANKCGSSLERPPVLLVLRQASGAVCGHSPLARERIACSWLLTCDVSMSSREPEAGGLSVRPAGALIHVRPAFAAEAAAARVTRA